MNDTNLIALAYMLNHRDRVMGQYRQNPLSTRELYAVTPRARFGSIAALTTALRNRLSRREAEPVATQCIGDNRQASMS